MQNFWKPESELKNLSAVCVSSLFFFFVTALLVHLKNAASIPLILKQMLLAERVCLREARSRLKLARPWEGSIFYST